MRPLYYPGPGEQITPIRAAFWHLQQEGQLNWSVRVIDGTKHLAALMADWTPDILITHWHGECTSADKRSLPGQIAQRLRHRRGNFGGSASPFLVAQISAGDPRFQYEPEEGLRLRELYDGDTEADQLRQISEGHRDWHLQRSPPRGTPQV